MKTHQYRSVANIIDNAMSVVHHLTGTPDEQPKAFDPWCYDKEVRATIKKELQDYVDGQMKKNFDKISDNPKKFKKYNELLKAIIAALEEEED